MNSVCDADVQLKADQRLAIRSEQCHRFGRLVRQSP